LRGENWPRSKAPGLPVASGGGTRACFAADRIAMAVPASRTPHGFQVVEFPSWTPPLLPRLTSLLPWTLQVSSAAAERGARTPVEGDQQAVVHPLLPAGPFPCCGWTDERDVQTGEEGRERSVRQDIL